MNEEELKKGCGKKYVHSQGYDICGEHYGDGSVALCPNCSGKLEGFQKGKLEQKKEELGFIKKIYRKYCFEILLKERIKQLQKEIGGKAIKIDGDAQSIAEYGVSFILDKEIKEDKRK